MKKKALELVKFFALCAIIFVLVVETGALIMRVGVGVGVALGYKPEMTWEELESSELYQRAFPDRIPKKDPGEIISDDHPNRIDSDGVFNPEDQEEDFVSPAMHGEYVADRWDAVEVDSAIADDPVSDGFFDFETGRVYYPLVPESPRAFRLDRSRARDAEPEDYNWPVLVIRITLKSPDLDPATDNLRRELIWFRRHNQFVRYLRAASEHPF